MAIKSVVCSKCLKSIPSNELDIHLSSDCVTSHLDSSLSPCCWCNSLVLNRIKNTHENHCKKNPKVIEAKLIQEKSRERDTTKCIGCKGIITNKNLKSHYTKCKRYKQAIIIENNRKAEYAIRKATTQTINLDNATPCAFDDAHRLAANIRKGSLESRLATAKELLTKHNGNYRKAFYDIDSLKIEVDKKQSLIVEKKKPVKDKEVLPSQTFFNKEAYQLAIRSMSTGEAWRLSQNEDEARLFLEAHSVNFALLNLDAPAYTLEAPVEPPVKPERVLETDSVPVRGEKVEISTIGRDSADQAIFRNAVSSNYNHCCAITGDSIAVEACHIQTHSDHYDNCVDNGIMLGVGLHRLFDAGIMIINPDSMTVSFMQDCFYKKHLEGAPVKQGKIPINKDKLKAKNLCID